MKVETPEIADQVPESEALPADLDAGTLPEAAVDSVYGACIVDYVK